MKIPGQCVRSLFPSASINHTACIERLLERHLFETLDVLQPILVLPETDPVPGIVHQALALHEAADRVEKLPVLVAVCHLAYVGAAGNFVVPFIKCARLYAFWKVGRIC